MSKHPAEIIKRPLLTEKGTTMNEEDNMVIFEIAMDANKIDVRNAVEKLYDVKVLSVRTQTVRGKLKRVGSSSGKRRNWKKAIVRLDSESVIDFFSAAT